MASLVSNLEQLLIWRVQFHESKWTLASVTIYAQYLESVKRFVNLSRPTTRRVLSCSIYSMYMRSKSMMRQAQMSVAAIVVEIVVVVKYVLWACQDFTSIRLWIRSHLPGGGIRGKFVTENPLKWFSIVSSTMTYLGKLSDSERLTAEARPANLPEESNQICYIGATIRRPVSSWTRVFSSLQSHGIRLISANS